MVDIKRERALLRETILLGNKQFPEIQSNLAQPVFATQQFFNVKACSTVFFENNSPVLSIVMYVPSSRCSTSAIFLDLRGNSCYTILSICHYIHSDMIKRNDSI